MRRVLVPILLISGLLLIAVGMLETSGVVLAQDDDEEVEVIEREYVGARECSDCHRDIRDRHRSSYHGMTLMAVEADAEPEDIAFVLGDFDAGEDLRTIPFPDGSERAFTLADVAFTLGAGRNYQAYVTALDDDVYAVLPAQWDVHSGEWVPLPLGESWPEAGYLFGDNCAGCHTVGLTQDADSGTYAWEEAGVQCEACHGPGSLHVDLVDDAGRDVTAAEHNAFTAAINIGIDAQVCGQCHSRGTGTSGHPYPIDYVPGDDLSATFTPVSTDNTDFWHPGGYAAETTMQYNEWFISAHASALETALGNSAAETACLRCHSVSYRQATRALMTEDRLIDPDAEAAAPLLLRALENSGLSPNKQRFMVEQWLPLALNVLAGNAVAEMDPADVIEEMLDIADVDEDDYDPASSILPLIMPEFVDTLIDAVEDANDGDPDDLEELNMLTTELLVLIIDEVKNQRVPASEAIDSTLVEAAHQYGVTCASCHTPHAVAADYGRIQLTDYVEPAPYAVCIACHQNTSITENMHHPVMEMFEGRAMVDGVAGVPSVHYGADEGPDCVACHMTLVPVGPAQPGQHANHTWRPILPNAAADAPPNSCSQCHESLTAADLQSLVADTQAAVRDRLTLAWARVGSVEQPEAGSEAEQFYNNAIRALQFIQNDGSGGVHNYAYTDALLDNANELLARLSVPGASLEPTEAPAPTATPSADSPGTVLESPVTSSGLRPITWIILVGTVIILLIGAVVLYRMSTRTSNRGEM